MNSARTIREELANSLTHGFGLLLSAIGFPVLVWLALVHGTTWHVVSCSVYGATLVLLYASSTFYHGCRQPAVKQVLRAFDHSAIFLLIAGTYTPFTLVTLRGPWGWTLFGIVWGVSVVGIIAKAIAHTSQRNHADRPSRFALVTKHASPVIYLALGWLVIIAGKPLLMLMTWHGMAWLLAGGLAYSLGLIFFSCERIPYNHAIWHLFVLAGSACHYVAVLVSVIFCKT